MSKKPIIGGVILAAIIGVVFVGAQINPDNPENTNVVFHVTLADPALYDENGFYVDYFSLEEGRYEFRFVPNGDSPNKLSIELWAIEAGKEKWRHFSEDFELRGHLVEDGLSSWYIWDYLGEKRISFDESYTMEIVINPNRNYDGLTECFRWCYPVSIDLIKLD
uniref:Uncharacterized protein n=1 Tax=uncultured marine thaumarchaeote KM3_71_H03 TaxID=1456259 RepID=A0A075HHF0_9ARCH|nr:hypothetical protein [uncultured marine thaumarchaeote KM3_71_H03]